MTTPSRYAPCPACGRRMFRRRVEAGHLCRRCNINAGQLSPKLSGRGNRHTSRMHQCKMPNCRKWFKLRKDQDPKWTWYCHDCRLAISEITTGVNWLKDNGIEVLPDEEVKV